MRSTGGDKVDRKAITPGQAVFLRRFFATDTTRQFVLTGGSALAGFHLGHRLSKDLDLFTFQPDAFRGIGLYVESIAADLGWQIVFARSSEYFRQYVFQSGSEERVQVDLVREVGPRFGEWLLVDHINVDAIENIGVNKIAAILGRTESKDFVDLHFILKAGHDFDHLFGQAQQKDLGLLPFFFAGALLQIQRLTRLPIMLKPITLDELQDYFVTLANRIIDGLNPEERNPFGA